MIYAGKEGDIINQYVVFTKVCSEQIALYGTTRKAITKAIRICKDRNVLKEYLESKEKEVVDIMMVLYDEQEIMRSYIEGEIYEARQEAKKEAMKEAKQEVMKEIKQEVMREANIESAKKFLQMKKFSFDEIAFVTGLTVEEVEALA